MDIHICFIRNSLWVISFLNELELICLHSIVSTQLYGFYYCYLILFNVNHLFADCEMVTSIAI